MHNACQRKIQWADKHINQVHSIIERFTETRPYKVGFKLDTDTSEQVAYIEVASKLPRELPFVLGDAIQNLYSSLDYLAWELVRANRGTPTTATGFPVSENIPTTKDEIARYDRQVAGMRKEAQDDLKALKLYRGANNGFWRLHKLNNINKHRTILTVGFSTTTVTAWGDLLDTVKLSKCGPLQEGSILARFPPHCQDHEDVRFTFDVALHEPEADAVCCPASEWLREMYMKVVDTAIKFESYLR